MIFLIFSTIFMFILLKVKNAYSHLDDLHLGTKLYSTAHLTLPLFFTLEDSDVNKAMQTWTQCTTKKQGVV
jgi:hypothetical protein